METISEAVRGAQRSVGHLTSTGRRWATSNVERVRAEAGDVAEDAANLASDLGSALVRWLAIGFAVLVLAVGLLCLATCTYAVFYWLWIPQIEHSFPLQFDYGPVSRASRSVAYVPALADQHMAQLQPMPRDFVFQPPATTVDLLTTHSQWNGSKLANLERVGSKLLYPGQIYTVSARIVMPESPANLAHGTLMLNADLLAANQQPIAHSARPIVMRYRSPVISTIRTVLLWLPMLLGLVSESQTHHIILFNKYREPHSTPTASARLTLSADWAQIYSADLYISAELEGIAYFMYHWFYGTATIAIGAIWLWYSILALAIFGYCFFDADVSTNGEYGGPSFFEVPPGEDDAREDCHSTTTAQGSPRAYLDPSPESKELDTKVADSDGLRRRPNNS